MDIAVALGAVRRQSVDIANLTSQLALALAGIELLQQAMFLVHSDEWDKRMVEDDDGQTVMEVTLRGEQYDDLMRVLVAVSALG
jgi:hypothetical protein